MAATARDNAVMNPTDLPLGRHVDYPTGYDAALLYPIPRALGRAAIGVDDSAPGFVGVDRWHAYELSWLDVIGIALLAGVGFTVSLLIGELAFGATSAVDDHVKIGVLLGSIVSILAATVVLRLRNRVYRRLCQEEERDDDHDGVPDVYQRANRDAGDVS